MSFSLSETIEVEDFEPLFLIQYKAFVNEPVLRELYPGGLEDSARSQNVARFKVSLGWTRPDVKVAKVVDDDTGQICAFATMPMFDGNPLTGAKDSEIRFPHVDSEYRPFVEWFFNTKNNRRRGFRELQLPGPYCYLFRCLTYADLQALGTDPARQREGAATMLLQWAARIIDEKGCRAMVESSGTAVKYGLYEKHGFRTIDKHNYVDKEAFPEMEGTYIETMVRDANHSV
ncbi:MAG: hypothetical protein Q9191_001479 [Dirinaria sp. TL-2023a]